MRLTILLPITLAFLTSAVAPAQSRGQRVTKKAASQVKKSAAAKAKTQRRTHDAIHGLGISPRLAKLYPGKINSKKEAAKIMKIVNAAKAPKPKPAKTHDVIYGLGVSPRLAKLYPGKIDSKKEAAKIMKIVNESK